MEEKQTDVTDPSSRGAPSISEHTAGLRRPLTVLQIASGFPGWGGTELHILNLSDQLVRRGHSVTVACRPGGWVANRAKEMGLPTMDATVIQQLQDWSSFGSLRRWCKKHQVDVVHTHWSTDAFVPAAAAMASRVPVRLMTRHSPYPFKTRFGRFFFTRVLYNRLLAVSQSVANTLVSCGVPEDGVTVIHHGTDVEAFEHVTADRANVRNELGLAPSDVALGIVGRVAEEKGHRYLVDALAMVTPDASLKLVIVGDGPMSDSIRAYVSERQVADRVIFCPFRSDVNNVINALDIVAVPSIWEEPCSAVIQQAMALSKPVIGTKVGGTPEMIVDDETGLLVGARQIKELAGAMSLLASDPQMRQRQGEAGASRVRELFTLQRMAQRIEQVYYTEFSRVRGAGSGSSAVGQAVPA